MKKFLSAVMSFSLIIGTVVPVRAADTEEMKEILSLVKSRINIDDEGMKFSSRYNETDGKRIYSFSWEKDDKRTYVTCEDNGLITSYDYYDNKERYTDSPSFSSVNEDTAKKNFDGFFKRVNPDIDYELTEQPLSLYSTGFTLNGFIKHDGVKIIDNRIYGYMTDENTVRYFNIQKTDINEYGTADKIKTTDEAQKAFSEKIGLELVYRSYWDKDKTVYYPAYIQKDNLYIDAQTGEAIKIDKSIALYNGTADEKAVTEAAKGGYADFTEEEIYEFDKISGIMTKEEIEKLVRNNKLLSIDNLTLSRISMYKVYNSDNEYRYGMEFSDDDRYITVEADAATGDIYGYYSSLPYDYAKSDTNEKQLDETAKQLSPSIADKFAPFEDRMARYENDIRVCGDEINAVFDDKGQLIMYTASYNKEAELPALDNIIDEKTAEKALFEALDYEQCYSVSNDKKAYLIYTLSDTLNVNAITGKVVGYDNTEPKDSTYTYNDIEGHYAKEMIEKLARYGIGFEGGKFEPDKEITKEEFKSLIPMYYNNEESGDELLTRETAAIMIVDMIGGGEYAKYSDIYVQPFNDVTENKGYIAILKAMGIINGDENGNFNPNKNMTRAEAASLIYNYLNRNSAKG